LCYLARFCDKWIVFVIIIISSSSSSSSIMLNHEFTGFMVIIGLQTTMQFSMRQDHQLLCVSMRQTSCTDNDIIRNWRHNIISTRWRCMELIYVDYGRVLLNWCSWCDLVWLFHRKHTSRSDWIWHCDIASVMVTWLIGRPTAVIFTSCESAVDGLLRRDDKRGIRRKSKLT